ncbi:MAG: hypothetical protein VW683_08830 [Betaproteobacteria bacterium]
MPERDYGLGGREAREAYDSAKAYAESQAAAGRDDPPPTRPRARPESEDTSESPTISIVDADTDETVGTWNVGSGDVTFSGDSSLSETTQQRKKSKSGLAVPEPKINIGPLEIKERDAKLDVSMDWSNVFDNLLKDAMPKGVNLDRFKTSWDGKTIKLLDVGMSFAEGGKVSDEAQLEMDLIMNEQVDPVSGNTAPVGAKPEEVRDDIDIRVSPNEYVVNAQTVRYFGEEFFDELQKAAAEGFRRIKEGEELPFRDDELDIEDDETEEVEPEGFAYGGRVKGYAEGDMVVPQPVGGGYGGYGGTGAMFTGYQSKTFINDETGQKIVIFFFNGRPLSRIPAGFREMAETPVEEQKITTQKVDSGSKDVPLYEQIGESWRTKSVDEWEPEDFEDYSYYLSNEVKEGKDPLEISTVEKGIIGLVGSTLGGPMGGAALVKLAEQQKIKQAEKVLSKTSSIIGDYTPLGAGLGVEYAAGDLAARAAGLANEATSYALGVNSYRKEQDKDRGFFDFTPKESYSDTVKKLLTAASSDVGSIKKNPFVDIDPYSDLYGEMFEAYEIAAGLDYAKAREDRLGVASSSLKDKPRSATSEAIAKYTDPTTGKEDTVTGTKFTEMLGGLKYGEKRSKADVETENLARAAGVSVDTYKGMSAYERSEALGGGGGAADDRERQAFQDKQQKLIASGGDVETAFAAEIARVDKKERRDFINNLKEDYLRAIG